jgi:hypothetical protein
VAAADPAQSAEVFGFLLPCLSESGYPRIAAMLGDGVHADSPDAPDLEFGLTRILDGIERLVDERA